MIKTICMPIINLSIQKIKNKKKNKESEDKGQEEKERNELCIWLGSVQKIYDDIDAQNAYDELASQERESEEEKANFDRMTILFNKFKSQGQICIYKSPSWSLFMERISNGIYTPNHPSFRYTCTGISVFVLAIVFISIFGSPIRFNNSTRSAMSHTKFKDGKNICSKTKYERLVMDTRLIVAIVQQILANTY